MVTRKKLFLIDGNSYIYRAFHAIPFLSNREGMPTNAAYGFTRMLLKLLGTQTPEFIAIAFDTGRKTFRHELYKLYKANRPEMPEALRPQISYVKDIVTAYNITSIEMEGYEADDVIGTLVERGRSEGMDIVIVSGDKDMLQLVDEGVSMFDPMKEIWYGPEEVIERFSGIEPAQVVEVMALAGDKSDNIPGVPGIGNKTAIKLLKKFGSLDAIYSSLDLVEGRSLRNRLRGNRDAAYLSLELASIQRNIPLRNTLEEFRTVSPDCKKIEAIFRKLGFLRLLREGRGAVESVSESGIGTNRNVACNKIMRSGEMESFCLRVREAGRVSISLILDGESISSGISSIGISLLSGKRKAGGDSSSVDLFVIGRDNLDMKSFPVPFKAMLESAEVVKKCHDVKRLYLHLWRHGIELRGVELDTMLAAYVLDPTMGDYSLQSLRERYLDNSDNGTGGIVCQGFSEEDSGAASDAYAIEKCAPVIVKYLKNEVLLRLFETVEMPLAKVLAKMETTGIKIDKRYLGLFSGELEVMLEDISAKIFAAAGGQFNINSPRQLSVVLFEKLQLKPLKKTKTGFSTDEGVLIALSKHHLLPSLVLNYRQITKLKSTYVDALLAIVDKNSSRVHTSFNQASTATGRLSSSGPNLQNIPVRTEMGRRIRESFIPGQGFFFLSADYSQIELRLLAHFSKDPILIESFMQGEDIHRRTAGEVFGAIPALVTEEMRRRAKAINFGIIYGMGAQGLSRELGINRREAERYIEGYFDRYRTVRRFIETTIDSAAKKGYVTTLFGRKRRIPELHSDIDSVRGFGERIAVNTVIQGTAADIIKVAMINIESRMRETGSLSRMILQIHDELLFEAKEGELSSLSDIVRYEMEGVVELSVPITVKISTGKNWLEAGG